MSTASDTSSPLCLECSWAEESLTIRLEKMSSRPRIAANRKITCDRPDPKKLSSEKVKNLQKHFGHTLLLPFTPELPYYTY